MLSLALPTPLPTFGSKIEKMVLYHSIVKTLYFAHLQQYVILAIFHRKKEKELTFWGHQELYTHLKFNTCKEHDNITLSQLCR